MEAPQKPPCSADEFTAEGPGGFKFRARGYDTVVGVMILAIGVFGYGLFVHMNETRISNEAIAKAIQDGVRVQRFTACLLSTSEALREAQYANPQSFCNRIAQ